uniref:Putative secreted protein n=1 Tax=Ixodes ricinus TaxID=34613 RepID=A0A147BS37_IXORI
MYSVFVSFLLSECVCACNRTFACLLVYVRICFIWNFEHKTCHVVNTLSIWKRERERENVSFTSWGAFRIPTAPTQSRLCSAHAE